MKKYIKKMIFIFIGILVAWTVLTLWAEYSGSEKTFYTGNSSSSGNALVIYNPDPIYNLDEQICKSFAEGLSGQDFYVKIATVKSARKDTNDYDLFVFCANTYNWAPDWLVKGFIQNHPNLNGKKVIAITVGSGSTQRARRILEETIHSKRAELLNSKTYWLFKPNDENRMDENNVKIALDMAEKFGNAIGKNLNN